ncbi:hypothetical protein C8J57DRAFT_1540383 [Mycena rebaudengoi]|nr:hypothetical protein C8J57DRAFT_1540383 [Mycena rebaudengoi]
MIDEPLHGVVDTTPYFHQVDLDFGDNGRNHFMVVKDPDPMDTGEWNQLLEEYGLSMRGNVIVLELDGAGHVQDLQEQNTRMATRAVICVFAWPDIALMILEHCSLVDLVQISHCSRAQRNQVRRRILSHIRVTLLPFLTREQQNHLWLIIILTGSAITGSVGSAITRPDLVPSTEHPLTNFNVSVPRGALMQWTALMRQMGAAQGERVEVRLALAETVRSVTVFQVPNPQGRTYEFVVTEAAKESVLESLLSSEWTHQMLAVTATKIVVIYPQLHRNNRTLQGYVQRFRMLWPRFWRAGWWYYSGSHQLPGASGNCGEICAFLWRKTYRFKGIGELAWGGVRNEYDVDGTMAPNAMREERLRWRLDNVCFSATCENNGNTFRI